MPEPTQPTQPEESNAASQPDPAAPIEELSAPVAEPSANLASARIRGPLPASPLERAKLESQGQLPQRSAEGDRSTMVAFGLLFVVPVLIILLSVLLLLPFINAQMTRDPNPGGAVTQSSSNAGPTTR